MVQVVLTMSQFGLIRTIRVMNEKSYYLEYDTTFSAEQAIKIKNLTIDNQPVYCCSLITPPGLEIPSGSSFSRTNLTGQVFQSNCIVGQIDPSVKSVLGSKINPSIQIRFQKPIILFQKEKRKINEDNNQNNKRIKTSLTENSS